MPGGYRSRYSKPSPSSPPKSKYSPETWAEYTSQTPVQHDDEDEKTLKSLRERGPKTWSQQDAALYDEISQRMEEREDASRAPLRRELQSYFADLNLPALPPPMAKSSLWLETMRPENYENEEVREFYVACEKGVLDRVKELVEKKKDLLQPIGLQDGLACAAKGNQVEVARYLLEECGATLHGAVIQAACSNLSLPLFDLCLQYGYHPNQQIPSLDGYFGTALTHCIENEAVVRLLLENGADPNVAPFHDNRKSNWGLRATPPMDRTSGLALDLAAKTANGAMVLLLEHSADPKYARPLHAVIELHRNRTTAAETDADDDWRLRIETLTRHGTDVNATTYGAGTALHRAVANQMWDVAEFLLEQGADPRMKQPASGLDSFAVAARAAKAQWEKTEDLDRFLDWLCDAKATGSAPAIPEGARENPLVELVAKRNKKDIGED